MKVLNNGSWNNFLSHQHFVQLIVAAIASSWKRLASPPPDSLEDHINRKLCAELRNDPAQRRLPFHVVSQWEDIDAHGVLVGKPDIRFMPFVTKHDDEFFVVECKRLRYEAKGKKTTANSAYIDGAGQGMTAFVDGRYPAPRGYAGMVGYVSWGPAVAASSLANQISKCMLRLQIVTGGTFAKTSWHPEVYETTHQRSSDTLCIYHVLLMM